MNNLLSYFLFGYPFIDITNLFVSPYITRTPNPESGFIEDYVNKYLPTINYPLR